MDEIICEGFLTKSPPERKINRARWHQRWFVLRRLRGEYLLQYFKDKNSVTPKGTIDLNNCEQVDQGLTFETKKFHENAFLFDIVTPKRKYFLVSRTEDDMIRWVRSICEVCGFHLDGTEPSELNEETVVQSQPMTIHPPQEDHSTNIYTDEPTQSAPIHSNGNLEDGYFELSDSVTGEGITTIDGTRNLAKSLPVNSISARDSGVATLDEPIDRESFDSTESSLPSDSAPPPPPKTPTAKTGDRTSTIEETNDIYDTPPVHARHSFVNDSGAIYDCPPVTRQPSQPVNEADELYKQVPPPRPSVTSLDYPLSPMSNGQVFDQEAGCDIYDVPPVKTELPSPRQSVYDTPPVQFQKTEEMSQSTDNLAKTFQTISIHNSMGSHSVASETFDIYDIPSLPTSANDLTVSSQDLGSVSPPMDMAPPRPPKPVHMQNVDPTTPPPSFDDTYNVPPNFQEKTQMNAADLHQRLSQEMQDEAPPSWNNSGHAWMDNTTVKPRYINTKRTEAQSASGMPINPMRARSSLDGMIPAPDPQSYVNVRNERYVFSPNTQSCYLPMDGSISASNNNTSFEFSDETYMAMQGSVDGTADSYTLMQSPTGPSDIPPPVVPQSYSVSSRNSQGEFPPPIPRSMSTSSRSSRNSQGEAPPPINRHSKQGEAPPPINRHSKPDRRSTLSSTTSISSHSPDLAAVTGAGSFYATEDVMEVQGSIITSPRTQSFSKKGMIPPPKPDVFQESFRRRTNTGGSTTSSSGESGVGGGGGAQDTPHYVTPTDGFRQPTLTDEVYVYKDPPPLTPKLEKEQAAALKGQSSVAPKDPPTFESIANANIPPPVPEEIDAAKIEYLELDHTKNEESPSPRPPKPTTGATVEYFDLDPKKTKALQDVTVQRQKESHNKTT